MTVPCYWLEPTDEVDLSLRRYVSSGLFKPLEDARCPSMPGDFSYHTASVPIGRGPVKYTDRGDHRSWGAADDEPPHDDPRWPTRCSCGYEFVDGDRWQLNPQLVFRVARVMPGAALEVGAETTIHAAPPGAMWDAWWYPWKGPDGRSLMAKLPNGQDWTIDSRANNCGRPDDDVHRCWVRHGEPPEVTVDKNGDTCNAGAGSILSGDYHGFLQGGVFT